MSEFEPNRRNRRFTLFALLLSLIAAFSIGVGSLQSGHAAGYPNGPGLVCTSDTTAAAASPSNPCPAASYTFDGPFPSSPQIAPTQLRVGVYINGSAKLNGFDITLATNSSVLKPTGIDLTGSILFTPSGSPTLITECVGGTLVVGTSCLSTDTPDTLHLVAIAAVGAFVNPPATGLLFTAIYSVIGTSSSGGVPIGFQTGCSGTTSVGGGVCVTITNATASPDVETAQGSTFNNSACSTTCTLPWVAISSNFATITVPQGATLGNQVTVVANAENGWPGTNSNDMITFSSTQSAGFGSPTFTASSCSTGGTSCSVNASLADNNPGTYSVTIYGTYVAFDPASVSTPTDTLVGSVTIQVDVQAVVWSIDGAPASSPQTVLMAQGANNPLSLFFKVQSLGGYSGTVTFATASLSDGGTGLSFNYPASFSLGSGQTITQTITATAASYGTLPALYQAQLTTSGPTLVNQTSATLSVHITGVSISSSASSVSFSAGTSASFAITGASLPSGTSGFVGKVTLTKTITGGPLTVTCPASLTLTAGGTSSVTCTASGTTTGSFVVTVTGTAGTNGAIRNSTSISVTVSASIASFNINPSPSTATGLVNSAPFSKITLKATNGFSGTVTLTETSSPGGITCGFSATGVPLTTTASVILSCSSISPGSYTVTVIGTKGTITNSTTLSFIFTDFSIGANPAMIDTTPGVAVTTAVSIAPVNGFAGNVTLSSSITPSTGLSCSLSMIQVTSGSGSSTLSCTGVGGTYAVTITGTSSGLSHTTTVTVNVADFTLAASPTSITVPQGPPGGTVTVTVTSIGGFSGTVALTGSSPAGFSTIFNPGSISISGTSVLTISVSPPATPGTYTVNVTGTSGPLTHILTITVVVTSQVTAQPPFFSQMTWNHRFSLSKYSNVLTWKFGVQNNSTSTLYFSVTITGLETSGTGSFTQTTPVFSEAAGKNTSGLTLSQAFSQTDLGETFVFTAVVHWGTTATSDPSQLPFTSTATNGVPTGGSFTVLA